MERLYLLRHGIAVPYGTPDIEDDDRPLTPKGEKRVRQVAYGLKHLGLDVQKIVSSPLPRAYRTAEIVARVLESPDLLETAEELRAGCSADSIASWLNSRSEERVMLVGHNPAFSQLIGRLVVGEGMYDICDLRRAGIAALSTFEMDSSRMKIDWIARPSLLRGLSAR